MLRNKSQLTLAYILLSGAYTPLTCCDRAAYVLTAVRTAHVTRKQGNGEAMVPDRCVLRVLSIRAYEVLHVGRINEIHAVIVRNTMASEEVLTADIRAQ